ncbi:uncharacterized protein [Epargyreus clarus]|uniref:uncharacterized protein n=1 Tax=Epargyreus clarus TaxID=520877 RepID=UPI003C2BDA05
MYTKILIVSLVQVALARHVPDGRLFRPDNSGNIEVHQDTYSDNYRTGRTEPHVENHELAILQHGGEPANNYSQDEPRRGETNFENVPMDQSNQRHHHRDNKQNNSPRFEKHNQTGHEEQNSLKTNLDTQSNVSDISSNQTTEYKTKSNDSSYQNTQDSVKTNEKSGNNSDELKVSSQSAKTNLNIHSRIDVPQTDDSLPEVRSIGDSMVFIDQDNPKPIGPVKTTTDNELRYNTNEDDKEEKWVWDATSTTTTTTTISPNKTEPGSDLDDRTSFNGDGCPKGEAKVLGKCVEKH